MSTVSPRIIERVCAIYSYYSEEKSSLSFQKGDFIDVLTKLESGWWDGWCHEERGWFPSNYVEIVKEDTPGLYTADNSLLLRPSTHVNSKSSELNRRRGNPLPHIKTNHSYDYINEREKKTPHQEDSHPIEAVQKYDEIVTEPTPIELMENWVERKTPQGKSYFCNMITQETTWNYDEIDVKTGCLKKIEKTENELKGNIEDVSKEFSWDTISARITHNIENLSTEARNEDRNKVQIYTEDTVKSIRLMLYTARALDKDTLPVIRDPKRWVMSSLSKLVLDSKQGLDVMDKFNTTKLFEKIENDANSVLVGAMDFITVCKQEGILASHKNVVPHLIEHPQQLQLDPESQESSSNGTRKLSNPKMTSKTLTAGMSSLGLSPDDRDKVNKVTKETNSMLQKAKYLLNQDLILSLRVYSHQIYTSAEELAITAHAILKEHIKNNTQNHKDKRAISVGIFRTLSIQIGQYSAILDEINLDGIDDTQIPSIATYRISRKAIYVSIGHMFNAVQALTDIKKDLQDSIKTVDQSVINIENVIETVEQSVIAMVSERKRNNMAAHQEDKNSLLSPTTPNSIPFSPYAKDFSNEIGITSSSNSSSASLDEGTEGNFSIANTSGEGMRSTRQNLYHFNTSTATAADITNIVNRRRKQSIRPDDCSADLTADKLGVDHHPDEIQIGSDGSLKGGTLPALIERLTIHDTLDTNFIATFLLTYRSFCTTEDVVTLLESRYNLRPPERLTPEQLEIWTERKQKLVRLRIFNVMKNWLENYYIDEDEHLLPRFEYFTNSYIRDSSEFAANQIHSLIKKRVESREAMKKIVPNAITGPDPIYPKNRQNITLLETDPVEMARQLSIKDFKLYSSVRPIECLGKAWSREGVHGSMAVNIKKSIQYCNRLTSWVTESILSFDEPKRRAVVIKYWVQVADICSKTTTQTLAYIRKLLGANRNFTEYREIIHSVNPPCIPFLGIYLQDLTFIEDGNPDYLRQSNRMINFAKRQKVAEVIRELKQFQSSSYNFHTIPEFQDFINTQSSDEHDIEELYERSLYLEPRVPDITLTNT